MPDTLIPDLITARADLHPDETAVLDGPTTLTRSELQAAATHTAARLVDAGVTPRSRVVIAVPPGAPFSVAALAAMLAGASYVPADPGADPAILQRIVDVTKPAVWVTSGLAVSMRVPAGVPTLIVPDVRCRVAPSGSDRDMVAQRSSAIRPEDDVYTIFTSGTTGPPKGVRIPHAALANLLHWQSEVLGLIPGDRLVQRSRLQFDFSVTELWLTLGYGGSLVYCANAIRNDPPAMLAFLRANRVTIAQFVPTVLEAVLAAADREPNWTPPQDLRGVVSNGEPLSDLTRRRFYRKFGAAWLWNQYGPAEATVAVTSLKCPRADDPMVMTVGRPTDGNRFTIVDEALRPVPAGTTGEVCISGIQVGSGYLGASAAEEARFVPASATSDRMYRTGDVGRITPDGELELFGRFDHQVKFRGVRIELEMIERVIEELEGVRQAAVRVETFDSPDGRRRQVLTALVAPGGVDPARVKAHCRTRLLGCEIPARVVAVDEFMFTPNGKLDFLGQLRLAEEMKRRPTAGARPELTATERIVVDILASRFGTPDVAESADIELDSLGIDSLDRAVLVLALEEQGLLVDLDELTRPSVTAADVARACRSGSAQSRRGSMPLTIDQLLEGLDSALLRSGGPQAVVVHASVPHLMEAARGVDIGELRAALVGHLVRFAAGGATVVIPAFTPSFATTGSYHHTRAVSESGSLATWVMDDVAEAVRNADPVYSFVVLGPASGFPAGAAAVTPFGPGSVAEWLELRNALIVGIATRDFTQTHRIEYLAHAPHHSHYELLSGLADYGSGPPVAVTRQAYLRDIDYHSAGAVFAQNTATTERLLRDHLHVRVLGASRTSIRSVACLDLRRALLPVLEHDPMALLKSPGKVLDRLASLDRAEVRS